jgi:alginate O-acetyltransferase complex protein AlgI
MLFNSFEYALFLVIIFFLYWFVAGRSFRFQNVLLLIGSYVFYASWDWRFLFLLAFSTFVDYFTGWKISTSRGNPSKKIWLTTSIVINVGFLCFFKYFNFFTQSFSDLLVRFHLKPNMPLLEIILPVGISFYTFHGLSYIFDIYNGKIQPTPNYVDYSLFVAFFPLLVAGPIERATHLLPQVKAPRTFDNDKASDGLRQILWGLFKKIVIADNCATIVNDVFAHPDNFSSFSLATAAVLFAFQIYGDFSGYSDIALGSARLFGFELLRNFNYPYFAKDIADFWRRWHLSLTSWFKDYVYIPLGGSRGSKLKTVRNTVVVFILSGIWHGANWTFLAWGGYHVLLFLPLLLLNIKSRVDEHAKLTFGSVIQMLITFVLVTIGWILFRADSLPNAMNYFTNMISGKKGIDISETYTEFIIAVFFIVILVLAEWFKRHRLHPLQPASKTITWRRYAVYIALILSIAWFGGGQAVFIYFQF